MKLDDSEQTCWGLRRSDEQVRSFKVLTDSIVTKGFNGPDQYVGQMWWPEAGPAFWCLSKVVALHSAGHLTPLWRAPPKHKHFAATMSSSHGSQRFAESFFQLLEESTASK